LGNLLHFYLRDVYGLKRFFKTFQNLLTIFQMAQYVSCKGHKPSCQGYRLAEIFSIFVYTPGKPGRGSEDAACAVSGFDSRVSLLTATYGLLKIQPSAACGTFHWTKITITARITAACVGVRTIGVQESPFKKHASFVQAR
jgi:hypothetical protein